jgi:hypothetical protein
MNDMRRSLSNAGQVTVVETWIHGKDVSDSVKIGVFDNRILKKGSSVSIYVIS